MHIRMDCNPDAGRIRTRKLDTMLEMRTENDRIAWVQVLRATVTTRQRCLALDQDDPFIQFLIKPGSCRSFLAI